MEIKPSFMNITVFFRLRMLLARREHRSVLRGRCGLLVRLPFPRDPHTFGGRGGSNSSYLHRSSLLRLPQKPHSSCLGPGQGSIHSLRYKPGMEKKELQVNRMDRILPVFPRLPKGRRHGSWHGSAARVHGSAARVLLD